MGEREGGVLTLSGKAGGGLRHSANFLGKRGGGGDRCAVVAYRSRSV